MKNRKTSAGTAADSEQKAEVPTSSPNNAKPPVVRSPNVTSNLMFPKINSGHCIGQDPIKSKSTKIKNLSKSCIIVKSSIKEYFVNNNKTCFTSVK